MIKGPFGFVVAALLLTTPAFAKDYKCPSQIKIDHQDGLVANMKKGTYRYNKIAIRPDLRLFRAGDWDRFATFDLGKHRGRCTVTTRVLRAGELNSLICECTDETNNIQFTAAKSIIGPTCETRGKLKFSCRP